MSRQRQAKKPPDFSTDDRQFDVSWAGCEDDVRGPQRLRYHVFAHKMGAHLTPPVGTPAGLQTFGLKTMMGCASVQLDDGGQSADRLWQRLRHTHLVEPKWQVRPYHGLVRAAGLPATEWPPATTPYANAPPLIKGYLHCGARLLGPPAVDGAFNTADLPLTLRIDDLTPRYRSHFLGD